MYELLRYFLIGLPIGITFRTKIGYIAEVEGSSMQPTLNPNISDSDYVLLNRWSVWRHGIDRGEIVAVTSPRNPSETLIKRVVGLAGDIVVTHGYKEHVLKVPEGHCWLEGDNSSHSLDSNIFGPVSVGLVIAKATWIVWPISRWQSLQSSTLKHK
ncbi:PREDICTED: mitochondrial inner membrane protease subunit 2 [Dufourea novaeangliae]|uniref:mitochondrial inner membrane protease subunit 2 n=1 Tax=Dufourea novaeangliae TaxID=178035 RepID=UPI0007678F21|nr:PREDICTED: mitochondrial inner membrane protease subunit 2 [Dufourea novaeangliae]